MRGTANEVTGLNFRSRFLLLSPNSSKPMSRQNEERGEHNSSLAKNTALENALCFGVRQAAHRSESPGCRDPAQKASTHQAKQCPLPTFEKKGGGKGSTTSNQHLRYPATVSPLADFYFFFIFYYFPTHPTTHPVGAVQCRLSQLLIPLTADSTFIQALG